MLDQSQYPNVPGIDKDQCISIDEDTHPDRWVKIYLKVFATHAAISGEWRPVPILELLTQASTLLSVDDYQIFDSYLDRCIGTHVYIVPIKDIGDCLYLTPQFAQILKPENLSISSLQ